MGQDGDDHGPLAAAFPKVARAYRLDVLATLLLFLALALLTGRVWRFAFDDEVASFLTQHLPLAQKLIYFGRGGDIHPALPALIFTGLRAVGLGEPGIRLVSLAACAIALALIELLTFCLMESRGECPLHTRLLTIMIFAMTPLALSVGDAIRWYPLFALCVASFLTLYLAGGSRSARLAAGVLLGVAASIDFLAIFVALPFALYRYLLERRFRPGFDVPFWAATFVFSSLGLWAAFGVATHRISTLHNTQFGHNPAAAIAQTVLGFFGGDAIGVSQAWAVLPAALITLIAVVTLVDRKNPGNPVHLFILLLAGMAVMNLAGFVEPRVFLYLAPVAVALQILFLARRTAATLLISASLLLAAEVGAAANLYHEVSPFKRESAIPFGSVIDFVHSNQKGSSLIVTSDDVLAAMLAGENQPARYVSRFLDNRSCFGADSRYDTIFLIYGHSARAGALSGRAELFPNKAPGGAGRLEMQTAQLQRWLDASRFDATAHFGADGDAMLKSRLTGTRLDPWLLTTEFYSSQR